jgi:hypothetical protein
LLDAVRDEERDKSIKWQDITPKELQPAVTAIRKTFDDVSWGCRESARRLCFAGLHPTHGNQQPTNLTTDLEAYKKYLVAVIGDRARGMIAASNQTPPAIFKAYLDLYRTGLIALIRSLFEEALQIGIAQVSMLKLHPVEWAACHLRILIDEQKSSVQLWIKRVCDIQDYSNLPQGDEELDEAMFWNTWRAPRLIRMNPVGNTRYDAGTVWEREDESKSRRLLESHCNMFALSCHSDLEKVAGMAQVRLAKRPIAQVTTSPEKSPQANAGHVVGPKPKPTATLDYRSELKRAVSLVWVINPRATDLDICRRLDADGGVDLPSALNNGGRDRLFVSAYKDPLRRHRLEVTFSRVRKDMRDKGLLPTGQRAKS